MEKICKKCGASKPLSQFYQHSGTKDGRDGTCSDCRKAMLKKRREDDPDHFRKRDAERYRNDPRVRERHRRYHASKAGKASMEKARKKWLAKSPEKRAAHVILGNAVRDGKIEKPSTCSLCGASGRIHGHHEDYAKPLSVIWCCSTCHHKFHEGQGNV